MKKSVNKTKNPLIIAIVSLILLSGILAFAPKRKTKEISSAVPGSPQSKLTPSASDIFDCGGRNDCDDDVVPFPSPLNESQHKYIAQAYDKFGFPLSGVKYKWTQDDGNDLIKFRELNPASGTMVDQSSITAGENDQEIYVQPNEYNIQNGEAVVNVLGYLGSEETGQSQSIDVNLYFCLNSWPSTVTFPFSDSDSPLFNPYTNFETFYCKDRGSATNPSDDYAALKVVERANKGVPNDFSYLCSGGGGNNLKCDRDYYIKYDGALWTKDPINAMSMPINIDSPDAIGFELNQILATEGTEWAHYNGAVWPSGNIQGTPPSFPSIIPVASWPNGPTPGVKLKPTALALGSGGRWLLIEGNFYATSLPVPPELPTSITVTNLAEAGWPTDIQFPDDVAWWSNAGNNYLLALKGDYYRIYSKNNTCNAALKCQTPTGREWGSCSASDQCYWGELFSLYSKREWPTSITTWQNNIKFSIKTIGLYTNNILTTSSCEYSGGICLLKEFLLIANPACGDGIDNDDDGKTDYPADDDCKDLNDNSESGTCDDGIDNDNDGSIDYPDDFSCDTYSDIEEDGCATQCCDNTDNDGDGLVDQADGGCDDKTDGAEANACADGIDNDSDSLKDLADPGCIDLADNYEKGITQCDDNTDNDGDGASDYPADFGCDRPGDDQELNNGANQCNDGIDNDGDALIDQNDPNCTDWTDNTES